MPPVAADRCARLERRFGSLPRLTYTQGTTRRTNEKIGVRYAFPEWLRAVRAGKRLPDQERVSGYNRRAVLRSACRMRSAPGGNT